MPAGQRDQLIKFQYEARVADGGGGATVTWTDRHAVSVRAAIRPLSGREGLEAGQVEGRAGYRIDIPNLRSIAISDRIVWVSNGNRVLNIRDMGDAGPRPIERTLIAEDAPEHQAG